MWKVGHVLSKVIYASGLLKTFGVPLDPTLDWVLSERIMWISPQYFFISVVMFTHFLFYSCSMIFIICLKLLFLIAQLVCYQLLNFFLSYDFKSVQNRCWILFLCFIFTELRICLWYFLGRIMMYCYSCWCKYKVPSYSYDDG